MISQWLGALPVLVVSVLVVYAPGLAALRLAGLRGLALLASAPLFSVAATALVAIVSALLGLTWSPLVWLIAMAVFCGVAALTGWWAGMAPTRMRSTPRWLIPTALAIGMLLTSGRLIAYLHEPDALSQTNDAVFHLNAVRFILETGSASSFDVSAVIGGTGFYPSAWHGIVSLIVLVTGAEITTAANMLTLVIGAMIWTIGIAWFTVEATGSRMVGAYAALLAGSLQSFPLLMFQWGVLYPNALSTALVPAAVASVMSMKQRPGGRALPHGVRSALLLLVVVSALLFAQPAGLLPWAAISALWLTSWLFGLKRMRLASRIGLTAVMWIGIAAVWAYLSSSTSGSHWPPFRGKLMSVVDVLMNGQLRIPFAVGVSALMIAGLIVSVRRARLRWLVVAWLGISGLYILAAAIGMPVIREHVLGAWYADPYRITALAPIIVIPLSALGADVIIRVTTKRMTGAALERGTTAAALLVISLLVLAAALTRPVAMPMVTENRFDEQSRYVATGDVYLDPDERKLLESLPDLVPDGARIIGNPSAGTGFGYFLSGMDVYPRTWASPRTTEWETLSADLRDAGFDPAVCAALGAYGSPQYVLDFGTGEEGPGRYVVPGMTDFAGQPGFEPVKVVGDASLWRITACAQ